MAQHDCPRCGGRYYSGQSVGAPDCPLCPRPSTPVTGGRIVVPYFAPEPGQARATAESAEGLRLVVSEMQTPLKRRTRPGAMPGQTVTVRLSVKVTLEEAEQLVAMIEQGRGNLRVRPAEPPQAPLTTLPQRPVTKAGDRFSTFAANGPAAFPADFAKALLNQVGPMPPANGNEAPPEVVEVAQLRADLGAVASAAAKVLGLLGCPFPGVHCLTFDAQGWRALIDAGDGKTWRLRAHVRGVDARAATRAALEGVAVWLTTHSPAWHDRMAGEPLREALAGLQEALAAGYARAGGSW